MTDDLIPCQRHRFDIPEDVAYLNCAYMAPLMDSVSAAGEARLRRPRRGGPGRAAAVATGP